MSRLTVITQRQVPLKKHGLRRLGVEPSEQIDFDELSEGKLLLRRAQRTGNSMSFIGSLADSSSKVLSIEAMNEIAAAGWANQK